MALRDVAHAFKSTEKQNELHTAALDHLLDSGEWVERDGRFYAA